MLYDNKNNINYYYFKNFSIKIFNNVLFIQIFYHVFFFYHLLILFNALFLLILFFI